MSVLLVRQTYDEDKDRHMRARTDERAETDKRDAGLYVWSFGPLQMIFDDKQQKISEP